VTLCVVAKPIFPGYSPEQIAVINKVYAGQGGSGYAPAKGVDRIGANSFTPYQPPPIPSGYYDPALDAQRDAASRGLLNTEQDIGLAGRRAGEDYGLNPNDPTYGYSAVGTIERNYGRDTADLATARTNEGVDYGLDANDPTYGYSAVGTIERNYGRDTQDLATARTNEGVDYGRNVEALTRNYQQLGRRQGEQARKYGVTSGGIALLSAAKRAENQGLEQRDLDTTHQRAVTQFDTTGTRLGEDRGFALGQARTTYDRGVGDRGNALSRARTEDTFYGLDVGQQKQFQAQQAGYAAPSGPANQFTRPDGTVVQTVRRGGYTYVYDQNGKQIEKRKAA
jgi:hypothetical protein